MELHPYVTAPRICAPEPDRRQDHKLTSVGGAKNLNCKERRGCYLLNTAVRAFDFCLEDGGITALAPSLFLSLGVFFRGPGRSTTDPGPNPGARRFLYTVLVLFYFLRSWDCETLTLHFSRTSFTFSPASLRLSSPKFKAPRSGPWSTQRK